MTKTGSKKAGPNYSEDLITNYQGNYRNWELKYADEE